MGLFDDVVDLVSDVTEPFFEMGKDIGITLATPVALVTAPVIAGALGITVGAVKVAIAAGCSTVGEVRDYYR